MEMWQIEILFWFIFLMDYSSMILKKRMYQVQQRWPSQTFTPRVLVLWPTLCSCLAMLSSESDSRKFLAPTKRRPLSSSSSRALKQQERSSSNRRTPWYCCSSENTQAWGIIVTLHITVNIYHHQISKEYIAVCMHVWKFYSCTHESNWMIVPVLKIEAHKDHNDMITNNITSQ